MSLVHAACDDVGAEVARAWAEHDRDPSAVLARLDALVSRLSGPYVAEWSEAVIHLSGPEHLADSAAGLAVLRRATDRLRDDGRALAILVRGRAVLHLQDDAPAEAEAMFDTLTSHRAHHEGWAFLVAARGAVSRGRFSDALAWFERGAKLCQHIGDGDPLLRATGEIAWEIGNQLLEAERRTDPVVEPLLRGTVLLARIAAERAGTWQEVQKAEMLLSRASIWFGEPNAAVAHAQAALAMCRANHGSAELLSTSLTLLEVARRAHADAAAGNRVRG